jgi:hypothetical protein
VLPWNRCVTVFPRTSEPLEAAVEHARLDELRFGPEPTATFGTGQAIPLFHLLESGQNTGVTSALEQAVELPDTGRPADEDLNSAGVAGHIGLRFLRFPNLPRLGADRAGKHLFSIWCHEAFILRAAWSDRLPLAPSILRPVFRFAFRGPEDLSEGVFKLSAQFSTDCRESSVQFETAYGESFRTTARAQCNGEKGEISP